MLCFFCSIFWVARVVQSAIFTIVIAAANQSVKEKYTTTATIRHTIVIMLVVIAGLSLLITEGTSEIFRTIKIIVSARSWQWYMYQFYHTHFCVLQINDSRFYQDIVELFL